MTHVEIAADGKAQKMGNNFHVIRYLLAALVLYSHSYGLLKLPEPGLFKYTFGSFAVKSFFVLSGYLISLSCLRSANLSHYFLNRVLRIAPALLMALVGSHFLGLYFNSFSTNPIPYIINGPVWTLSWEVLCYCLCGLLWWFGSLSKSSMGPIVTISWLLYILMPQTNEYGMVVAPLFLMFFTGSFIALSENGFNFAVSGPLFAGVILAVVLGTH